MNCFLITFINSAIPGDPTLFHGVGCRTSAIHRDASRRRNTTHRTLNVPHQRTAPLILRRHHPCIPALQPHPTHRHRQFLRRSSNIALDVTSYITSELASPSPAYSYLWTFYLIMTKIGHRQRRVLLHKYVLLPPTACAESINSPGASPVRLDDHRSVVCASHHGRLRYTHARPAILGELACRPVWLARSCVAGCRRLHQGCASGRRIRACVLRCAPRRLLFSQDGQELWRPGGNCSCGKEDQGAVDLRDIGDEAWIDEEMETSSRPR